MLLRTQFGFLRRQVEDARLAASEQLLGQIILFGSERFQNISGHCSDTPYLDAFYLGWLQR